METNKPARTPQTSDKFILRLPEGMRDQIAEIAKTNNRSMNAEVVARLQGSFEPNIASLSWLDLVKILEEEERKRGTKISITVG